MKKTNVICTFSFLATIMFSALASAEANKCISLFDKETELLTVYKPKRSQISDTYNIIKTNIEEILKSERLFNVLSASEKPNWNDYNQLKSSIVLIKNFDGGKNRITYLNAAERVQLTVDIKELKFELDQKLKIIEEKINDPTQKFQYIRFIDYHIAYFKMLEEINRLLNVHVFPLPDFTLIKSDVELKTDAEKLLKRLESITENTFLLSGHENLKAFEKYAEDFSPLAKRRLKLVKDELVVAMHRPENARFWIPLAGFQNQRITGSSKGTMYADSTPGTTNISGRDNAEATLTLTDLNQYVPLSARYKPNYAEARPGAKVTDIKPGGMARGYGSDLWIIKKSVVEKRATWTPTDSLGPGRISIRNNSFDDIFIPWKYRSISVPYSLSYKDQWYPTSKPNEFKFENLNRWSSGNYYFEVQIFGPLTIDDVQAFHFQANPPDKELYNLLMSKGIEVWDERAWPAMRYNGEESK